jgi:hypothetical protein
MSKKIGRLVIPIFFVFWGFTSAKGQKHEIGLGAGVLNYSGDLSTVPNVAMSRPGIMGFYRFNVSPVVSLRASLMFGGLAGKDSNKDSDPVGKARQVQFSATINQFAAAFEYNFFDYKYTAGKRGHRLTPYFTAGLSFFNFEHQKLIGTTDKVDERYAFNFAIPFGLGLKYRVKSRVNFNAEFLANKTFTDYLDGVSSYPTGSAANTKYLANPLTSDWFYYLGVSVSYTFYKIYCPD